MPPSDLKRLALLMAVNCVRNTVIEDYHADGKLSDAEMKALNQEVVNKIYTFLHYLFKESPENQEAFLISMGMMYPSGWDKPKLDTDFVNAVNLFKKMGNPIKQTSHPISPPGTSTPTKKTTRRKKK